MHKQDKFLYANVCLTELFFKIQLNCSVVFCLMHGTYIPRSAKFYVKMTSYNLLGFLRRSPNNFCHCVSRKFLKHARRWQTLTISAKVGKLQIRWNFFNMSWSDFFVSRAYTCEKTFILKPDQLPDLQLRLQRSEHRLCWKKIRSRCCNPTCGLGAKGHETCFMKTACLHIATTIDTSSENWLEHVTQGDYCGFWFNNFSQNLSGHEPRSNKPVHHNSIQWYVTRCELGKFSKLDFSFKNLSETMARCLQPSCSYDNMDRSYSAFSVR